MEYSLGLFHKHFLGILTENNYYSRETVAKEEDFFIIKERQQPYELTELWST